MSGSLYKPLPSPTSTRVLKLDISPDSDPISATITTIDITQHPKFHAISYTWGTDLNEQEILVDGHVVRIRKNLHDFLLILRREKQGRPIWIDAISISQNDLQEKAQQVQMIGEIFGAAKRVFVWTGPHSNNSQKLFDDVGKDASAIGKTKSVISSVKTLGGARKRVATKTVEELNPEAWVDFINRPYFSRLWIIQELALARSLVVYCGDSSLDWATLIESQDGLGGVRHHLQRIPRAKITHQRGDTRHGQTPAGMIDIVGALRYSTQKDDEIGDDKTAREISMMAREFQHAECYDRRDRIYALMSLEYLPSERAPYRYLEPISVDYTVGIPSLFIEACQKRLGVSQVPFTNSDPQSVHFRDIQAAMKMLGQPILLESRHVEVTASLIEGLLLTAAELDTILETIMLNISEPTAEWKWWCYFAGLVICALFVEGEKWEFPSRRGSTAIDAEMQEKIRAASLMDGIEILRNHLKSLSRSGQGDFD